MKTLTTFVILFSALLNLSAQYSPMLEIDKHWRFDVIFDLDFGGLSGGFILNVGGDTLIANQVYKKMIRNDLVGQHNCPMPPCFEANFPYEIERSGLYALFREDTLERKVYHLPHNTDQRNCQPDEYVLFDFSMEVGDTLSDCLREKIGSPNDPESGLVDSITSGIRYDRTRRIINTLGVFPLSGLPYLDKLELMEGIGLENHGFFPGTLEAFADVCYGDFAACNILSSTDRVAVNSNFQIAPNPASTAVSVIADSRIEHLELLDAFGKRIMQAYRSEINVTHLPNGVYVMKVLFADDSIGVKKFLKVDAN